MSTPSDRLFLRKASLVAFNNQQGTDLSELRFKFRIVQSDTQTPNNASITVYNLSDDTVKQIRGEYNSVKLQAGYENSGTYGVIFNGTIKQFRIGRESATETYLQILAADGDIGYNFGVMNQTFAAGSKPTDHINAAAKVMGLNVGYVPDLTGRENPAMYRGKVGFGMARAKAKIAADTMQSTWSIQNGKIQVIPQTGFLPGQAVKINALTGMIGIPEQTDDGIHVRSLLNAKMVIGGLVQLNSKDINQLIQQNPNNVIPFNQNTGIQYAAKVAEGSDGLYRIYVAEHVGDTRGNDWYTDLTCLAVKPDTGTVAAFG